MSKRVLVVGESVAAYAAAVALAGEARLTHAPHGPDEVLATTVFHDCTVPVEVSTACLEAHVFDIFTRFRVSRAAPYEWIENAGAEVRAGRRGQLAGDLFDACVFGPQGSSRVVAPLWSRWWNAHASVDVVGDVAVGFGARRLALVGDGPRLLASLQSLELLGLEPLLCIVGSDAPRSTVEGVRGFAQRKPRLRVLGNAVSVTPWVRGDAFAGVRVGLADGAALRLEADFVGFAGELAVSWDSIRGPIQYPFVCSGVAVGISPGDFGAQWASGTAAAHSILRGRAT